MKPPLIGRQKYEADKVREELLFKELKQKHKELETWELPKDEDRKQYILYALYSMGKTFRRLDRDRNVSNLKIIEQMLRDMAALEVFYNNSK